MPAGSNIYKTEVKGNPYIKALAVEKGGKRVVVLLNVSKKPQTVKLTGDVVLQKSKTYLYAEGHLKLSEDEMLLPETKNVTVDLYDGITVKMPGESMWLVTDFDY